MKAVCVNKKKYKIELQKIRVLGADSRRRHAYRPTPTFTHSPRSKRARARTRTHTHTHTHTQTHTHTNTDAEIHVKIYNGFHKSVIHNFSSGKVFRNVHVLIFWIFSTNFNAQFSIFINNMFVTLLFSTCFMH